MKYTGSVLISKAVGTDFKEVPHTLWGLENLFRVTGFERFHFKDPKYNWMQPGVYFLCTGNEVMYVGQSEAIAGRLNDHKTKHHTRYEVAFYIPVAGGEKLRKQIEAGYIWIIRPRYNRVKPKMVISDLEAEFAIRGMLDEYQSKFTKTDWKMRKDLPYFMRQIVKHPELVLAYQHVFAAAGFTLSHSQSNTEPAKFQGIGQGGHEIYI